MLIKVVGFGVLPLFNRGENEKSITYIGNVVQGAILAVECDDLSNGEIYNLTDNESYKIVDIGKMIADSLSKKPLMIKLPTIPFKIILTIWDMFAGLFQGKLPLLKRKFIVYLNYDIASNAKIREQLGFEPMYTINQGLRRMVEQYQKTKSQDTD